MMHNTHLFNYQQVHKHDGKLEGLLSQVTHAESPSAFNGLQQKLHIYWWYSYVLFVHAAVLKHEYVTQAHQSYTSNKIIRQDMLAPNTPTYRHSASTFNNGFLA